MEPLSQICWLLRILQKYGVVQNDPLGPGEQVFIIIETALIDLFFVTERVVSVTRSLVL